MVTAEGRGRAGALLLAGPDGVLGGDVAGFADQRELELLLEAGFTPLEAIRIGCLNGAKFLKQSDRIGSLATGKQANIVLVKGDPSSNIRDSRTLNWSSRMAWAATQEN